ncbi:NUDIX domain-containing protein [Nocardiopsis sp. Huas11]|uniref:NUDIX hydrolase n=1 Tax=Nocardiopsis sp. Huas11 TaxID=2183912 RepID=UPI000EB5B6B8|nr:NUDIX domain-containing protein [Nocardiopsis sp. Huas11]RKS08107.1 NUDIX domain-containing protein [Nocardiopsis sp. Huas11]
MPELPLHSVSVTGIVPHPDDGRILMIKRADNGRWVPPGGVLELDETPERGAVREVFEETGVRIEPVRLTGVYKNMKRGVVCLTFLCDYVGGQPTTSEESREVVWLTADEAIAVAPESQAARITDALAPGGPFVRIHDGTYLLPQD